VIRSCRKCETDFSSKKGAQLYCDPCRSACSVAGCETPAHTRGYCATHWSRLRKHGDAGGVERQRQWQSGPCSVGGCEKVAEKRGFCELHYKRQRETGEPGPAGVLTKPRGVPCEVSGCTRLADAAGLCNMHYTRVWRGAHIGGPDSLRRANGEGHINAAGYLLLMINGRKILAHRYVMEQMLGRRLTKAESVHHVDGKKLNNDPANLELWVTHQPSGQRVVDRVRDALAIIKAYPAFAATERARQDIQDAGENTDSQFEARFAGYNSIVGPVGFGEH
jgi:hypothetical protein